MARPAKRGEALASLFLVSYLGLTVPIIGPGVATHHTTVISAITWFAGVVLALLIAVGALTRSAAR
ncbi:MAG TPA: hypothetical protein VHV74_20690 [Pseudonocardiaceae bacterium]|jgi:hypothetical protein|nr:hypothetical protein [Pseudonocardiaceae bacterium]